MSNMNEYEFESELNEFEAAGETGEGEGILGAPSGLFGEGELEQHEQHEFEGLGEWEAGEMHELGEFDGGEQFLGKIARFVKNNAGLLKKIAKIAAPVGGTAIGGALRDGAIHSSWRGRFARCLRREPSSAARMGRRVRGQPRSQGLSRRNARAHGARSR